jgi:hypothetical protein
MLSSEVLSAVIVSPFPPSLLVMLMRSVRIVGMKGRSAVFIAKGPSKKRKWAEYEAVHKEFGELKDDKWNFLTKVKRIRTEHEVLHNVMSQIREQNPDMD